MTIIKICREVDGGKKYVFILKRVSHYFSQQNLDIALRTDVLETFFLCVPLCLCGEFPKRPN